LTIAISAYRKSFDRSGTVKNGYVPDEVGCSRIVVYVKISDCFSSHFRQSHLADCSFLRHCLATSEQEILILLEDLPFRGFWHPT
jgi:hypothetical protein